MDIPREPKKKTSKYVFYGVGAVLLVLAIWGFSTLEPRAPTVARATLYVDEVKRGEMLRQVRGPGTLVPENIRWISAVTSGRVDQVLARPGVTVDESTVILILSNPDVQMEALQSQRQLSTEEATLVNLRTTLESQKLAQEGAVAAAKANHLETQRQVVINEELATKKLIADSDLQRSKESAEEARTRYDIAQKQMQLFVGSIENQLSAQRSQVERAKAIAEFQNTRVASMRVTTGAIGVLTELPLEIGQWANSGATLAKVVEPGRLKAVLRIPETQAKDLAIGQPAAIDTRNGIIAGNVARIDPAAQNGTVTVDVALDGPLPAGARPDLSVDGTVEIERLDDVLFMARPSIGQAESTVELFRLSADGREAHRVRVTLGRVSVSSVEIKAGLEPGDKVILGDMSQWDGYDRIIIK